MKRAIFLLALCAFPTVFANFMEELEKVRIKGIKELNDVVEKFRTDVEVIIQYLKSEGVNDHVYKCMTDYDLLVLFHETQKSKYEDCYKKGFQERDIEIAKKCYSYNLAALKKKDELYRVDTKICLVRYFHVLGRRGKEQYKNIQL